LALAKRQAAGHVSMASQASTANADGDDDYAPEPGLRQCFPVLAPLSDKRLGPQDVMNPSAVWSQIREKELTDDSWSFKRDRAKAELAWQQGLATKLRHHAEHAERDTRSAASSARAQLVDIERAVDERKTKAAESVRQMRMRLQEVQKLRDEAACACRERMAEAELLLKNEQSHTAEVRELAQHRRQAAAAAWRQNEGLQAESEAHLTACDKEVEASELEAKQRVEAAKLKVQGQIAQAMVRNQEELRAARERLVACEESCRYRLEVESQRKEQREQSLQKWKTDALARLEIDQFIMQNHLTSLQKDCAAQVQNAAKRREVSALEIEKKVGALDDVFSSTAARSMETQQRERHSILSMGQAVHTLGEYVSCRQQYSTCIDERLSSCLQGHLHGVPGIAAPSPRMLTPSTL